MSKVKSKNTTIELRLRSELHKIGLRYSLHARNLPGTPDVVFRRKKLVIFIDGDFWHGYRFDRWKNTLKPFWFNKIASNVKRDIGNFRKLRRDGWTVVRVWGHQIDNDVSGQVARIVTLLGNS